MLCKINIKNNELRKIIAPEMIDATIVGIDINNTVITIIINRLAEAIAKTTLLFSLNLFFSLF